MCDAEKRRVIRRYFLELWNQGRLELAEEILAPGFGIPGSALRGPEAVRLYISSYRAAFPNIRFTILSMHVQGDSVAVAWVATGAHDLSEQCPDARKPWRCKSIGGLSVYRLEGGKIAAMWLGLDQGRPQAPHSPATAHRRN